MSAVIDTYISALQNNLAAGNATEHTHRPALKSLLDALNPDISAVNEPKQRADCGAPDYVILRKKGNLASGHVEAKDVGVPLSDTAKSNQLKRYRKFLPNLILTDYVDFWHYLDGERVDTASLGTVNASTGKINTTPEKQAAVAKLLAAFLDRSPEPIRKARDLAHRLAQQAHMIRDIVGETLARGQASRNIKDLRHALKAELVPNLDGPDPSKDPQFPDLYAQTLTYGLFAAACNHHPAHPNDDFTLAGAAADIPKTNPLLRQLFNAIHGLDFNDEPHARFVHDIVATLTRSTIAAVLEDFGTDAARKDPILHFYETFLARYDPETRERRGVYYTPEPVVSYIVRSVDHLLKTRFKITDGLADTTTLPDQTDADGNLLHRTLILDPAVGSGTFLYSVVQHIRDGFQQQKNAGLWKDYVHDHLLPRLHGFELLMAPYAMAHLKLGMQLAAQDLPKLQQEVWTYGSTDHEDRLRVYLTNTLARVEQEVQQQFGTLQRTIHEEAAAADRVKRDLPILVVLGNPPYSGISANNDPWIDNLLKGKNAEGKTVADRSYYHVNDQPLGEKKVWLQDDYVKFIRWAQHRLEQTGQGILAFITNHGYLDNPTFRGMRYSLMQAFDEIYLLDLHGNAKKKETAPDGSADQNVFDIQQGVAICLMVKLPGSKPKGSS